MKQVQDVNRFKQRAQDGRAGVATAESMAALPVRRGGTLAAADDAVDTRQSDAARVLSAIVRRLRADL